MGPVVIGILLLTLILFILKTKSYPETGELPLIQHATCTNNLLEIGMAFKIWSLDNRGKYPFNVSTNDGGTLEMCAAGKDGFDSNAPLHFQVTSNEMPSPNFLVCPADRSKKAAGDFLSLRAGNITYRLRSGPNINPTNTSEILAVCPIDGNTLYCDGTVKEGKRR